MTIVKRRLVKCLFTLIGICIGASLFSGCTTHPSATITFNDQKEYSLEEFSDLLSSSKGETLDQYLDQEAVVVGYVTGFENSKIMVKDTTIGIEKTRMCPFGYMVISSNDVNCLVEIGSAQSELLHSIVEVGDQVRVTGLFSGYSESNGKADICLFGDLSTGYETDIYKLTS